MIENIFINDRHPADKKTGVINNAKTGVIGPVKDFEGMAGVISGNRLKRMAGERGGMK